MINQVLPFGKNSILSATLHTQVDNPMSNIQFYSSRPGSIESLDSGSKQFFSGLYFQNLHTFIEMKITSSHFNEVCKFYWGDKWDCQTLYSPQFFSSLPSAQSSSPSHFHSSVIQRPFVHWNWEGSHLAFLPTIRREHWAELGYKGGKLEMHATQNPWMGSSQMASCRLSRLSHSGAQSWMGLGVETDCNWVLSWAYAI